MSVLGRLLPNALRQGVRLLSAPNHPLDSTVFDFSGITAAFGPGADDWLLRKSWLHQAATGQELPSDSVPALNLDRGIYGWTGDDQWERSPVGIRHSPRHQEGLTASFMMFLQNANVAALATDNGARINACECCAQKTLSSSFAKSVILVVGLSATRCD
jgi:hypothetical protein